MSISLLPPMAWWAASLLWSTQLCHFMGVIACKKSGGRKLNLSGRKLLLKYASSSPPTSQVVFNGNILTGASCYHRCQDRVRGPVSEQESQTVIGVRTMWLIGTILFQRLTRSFLRAWSEMRQLIHLIYLSFSEFFISVSGGEFLFISLRCLVFNLEIP